MALDPLTSSINTSGGLRARLEFLRGQESFKIPEATVQELEERGVIVMNKNDFVAAVIALLSGEVQSIQSLVDALSIPTISSVSGNLLKKDGSNAWYVLSSDLVQNRQTVVQNPSSSGANISLSWATPFADLNYSVSLVAVSDPGAAWGYHVISQTASGITLGLNGISSSTIFKFTAEGAIK